ncbi:MAG: aminoacyl-tRNA hydrolase [Treponema sp.]|jgi:ribosome-associated protein|nr:aminoacyl-tRNA hydrolase [Treponema sp.]
MNLELLHASIRAASYASFSRSGGPGGQNVNKLNTKVTLRVPLAALEGLSAAERDRLVRVLSPRLSGPRRSPQTAGGEADAGESGGELVIASSEERSQRVNLERAYARAEALVSAAARLPKQRRPTKPGKAARERRLAEKRRQGEKKVRRRTVEP